MTGSEAEDRAAIVDLLNRSRIAIWTHDFDSYASCFVHADYVTRWHASPSVGIFRRIGWDDIAARVRKLCDNDELRIERYAYDTVIENLNLRIEGDMAWATFDQVYPSIGKDQLYYYGGVSHEARVLERHNGIWLIVFLGVMHGSVGHYDTPILQVTADGEVTWKSPTAPAALEDDDDLTIRNGRVRFRDSKANQKLQAALRWAAARDTSLLPQRGTHPIVIEAGEGLPTKVYWVFAEGGQILLSLSVPGIDADRLKVAAAIFGLSPAQKQVAGLVVEGLSHREIAERAGISQATVRTHVNRVFEKTGVRTQPALVRVLLSSAPPV
ncbi:response regulator transcription factor [Devosia sp. CN2-171]|uniref:response regulator transcription factor n=1 Tax=Devosia sp. CN2-171 TaxID=3400909 RepID=UPI003BF88667